MDKMQKMVKEFHNKYKYCQNCRKIPKKCNCTKNKMRCKKCNSTNLRPDHGGYYYHAKDNNGTPYLCLDCANNSKTPWKWQCLICEKEIPFDPHGPGNDNEGLLPNLYGGTIEIHFGYGSKFDQLEDMIGHRDMRIQSAICDECFEKKQSLTRKVEVRQTRQYIQQNEYFSFFSKCPKCKIGDMIRRKGVHFDHELRCSNCEHKCPI